MTADSLCQQLMWGDSTVYRLCHHLSIRRAIPQDTTDQLKYIFFVEVYNEDICVYNRLGGLFPASDPASFRYKHHYRILRQRNATPTQNPGALVS